MNMHRVSRWRLDPLSGLSYHITPELWVICFVPVTWPNFAEHSLYLA